MVIKIPGMAGTIRGMTAKQYKGSLAMLNINKVAEQIRQSFASGTPCQVPMMRGHELSQLLDLLKNAERVAA